MAISALIRTSYLDSVFVGATGFVSVEADDEEPSLFDSEDCFSDEPPSVLDSELPEPPVFESPGFGSELPLPLA
jgi:hypothetical protein